MKALFGCATNVLVVRDDGVNATLRRPAASPRVAAFVEGPRGSGLFHGWNNGGKMMYLIDVSNKDTNTMTPYNAGGVVVTPCRPPGGHVFVAVMQVSDAGQRCYPCAISGTMLCWIQSSNPLADR